MTGGLLDLRFTEKELRYAGDVAQVEAFGGFAGVAGGMARRIAARLGFGRAPQPGGRMTPKHSALFELAMSGGCRAEVSGIG